MFLYVLIKFVIPLRRVILRVGRKGVTRACYLFLFVVLPVIVSGRGWYYVNNNINRKERQNSFTSQEELNNDK